MVIVHVDKREKKYIIHEDKNCQNIKKGKGKVDDEILNHNWIKCKDIQLAKYMYLLEYEDYSLSHHCYLQQEKTYGETDVPFNDYTRHHQTVLGPVGKRVHISSLPKWLRVFYYFVFIVILVGIIIIIIYS
ncbi:hypothetical protein [Evansella tamaricis]|uniref:CYIR protein n=1 Tax=Evansella tamaricis TaxID=2069301 RepID=A0ABS6JM05_9BACI|nr:hypothetical protein [Evansella tamaricis]MBU9714611.1 hypothetical protein [Evansella tamaricis]